VSVRNTHVPAPAAICSLMSITTSTRHLALLSLLPCWSCVGGVGGCGVDEAGDDLFGQDDVLDVRMNTTAAPSMGSGQTGGCQFEAGVGRRAAVGRGAAVRRGRVRPTFAVGAGVLIHTPCSTGDLRQFCRQNPIIHKGNSTILESARRSAANLLAGFMAARGDVHVRCGAGLRFRPRRAPRRNRGTRRHGRKRQPVRTLWLVDRPGVLSASARVWAKTVAVAPPLILVLSTYVPFALVLARPIRTFPAEVRR
jgi:hypothetical protein